jgi:hypothetical protein
MTILFTLSTHSNQSNFIKCFEFSVIQTQTGGLAEADKVVKKNRVLMIFSNVHRFKVKPNEIIWSLLVASISLAK